MKQQVLSLNNQKENSKTEVISKNLKIALLGNPNSGKSSLFNHLTGLNQKIGNFPGVTVDKKSGFFRLNEDQRVEVIDLPGTYSIYPRSLDERIVFDIFSDPKSKDCPDLAIVIVDMSNLRRNMLLFTQIKDLGIPVILVLNMMDIANKGGFRINTDKIEKEFNVPVVITNARKGEGIDELKKAIDTSLVREFSPVYDVGPLAPELIQELKNIFHLDNSYRAYQLAQQYEYNTHLNKEEKELVHELKEKYDFRDKSLQGSETIKRYEIINQVISASVVEEKEKFKDKVTEKIDRVATHKSWGYLVFLTILFLIFQAIFAWATVPMDFIDFTFSGLSAFLQENLPQGALTDLLTEGIIPGIAGILIFVPQIAILFAFIALLEETGYMSRVVFLMDKVMRPFGLSGKSVVPLVSGVACAIPAIMSTRNIENWKDRIITIFVTPLMSCSARLPVYAILIALVVPSTTVLGIFNLQGLALLGMYIVGFLAAIFSAALLKIIVRAKDRPYFIMELPTYKMPRWKNVGISIVEKVKTFVMEAGKIIFAISIILWVLASYGPANEMANAEEKVAQQLNMQEIDQAEFERKVEAYKLEHSYAGKFGKFIEPVIEPIGYDWKIGIALITSFAAREVFVGTMATIYSIGADFEDEATIKTRLKSEVNPETGKAMFTPAVAFSLLIFYAFAMQCMSTLAVVHRETKSWKWPMLQLIYLSGLAYLAAFIVYNIMK